jgi:predicted DNA-binding transcriptional regulator YafY
VSRRTILRDLNRLRSRGFDIAAASGPGGGVQLRPTSVMITSRLDGEEVAALILSVAIAKATPWIPFAGAAEKALAKIEAALPRQRVGELRTFMQRVLIGDPSSVPAGEIGIMEPTLVPQFERAFTGNLLLRFDYTDGRRSSSRRTVEPHGLLVRAPLWYVIAWDLERDAPRLFRTDRVRRPEATSQGFLPRPHELVTGVCPDAKPVAPHADAPDRRGALRQA